MEPLLDQIFLDYCVYGPQPPSKEYTECCHAVSAFHDKVSDALGRAFSEDLWFAHSQLSLVEMREAFRFGLTLALSITRP